MMVDKDMVVDKDIVADIVADMAADMADKTSCFGMTFILYTNKLNILIY